MLDAETKARIDSARDILVGKVPDPKSQVEQITIALIYKFMDDMDRQSEELGGKSSFFSGEFKPYAWTHILDKRLGGAERIRLYVEGIDKMNENPRIPQLFRDIFKGAFLPYRDPETLNLFLKEINGFTYDHSERLGDAFEYLLSVLGSQGEAGQFRTPRHIINFIVRIVDPKKHETILDPACGTAGFLISAYKHILVTNSKDRPGDLLTVDERGRLMGNFCGYDISPDMVRLSRANMYLHGFPQPRIHEYDTLTSEERWDERYDLIMANPPFMTPKGGIRPHNRFSIKATRSEVLFVDYIAEHLNVNGRAGVIVPEGIIFQSQNAYKTLRKMLVENYLWCVVSLPPGVFNPYSGVKTSILLMDKALAKRTDEILFVKIENDGFDLGAQRRPIEKNDLPEAEKAIQKWKINRQDAKDAKSSLAHSVSRKRILESPDCNLSGERYKDNSLRVSTKWPIVKLGDACEIDPPKTEVRDYDPDLEVTFVPMSSVQENVLSIQSAEKRKLREVLKGYTYFRDGDVILAKITPCFQNRKCAIASGLLNGIGFGSTEFIVIRPAVDKILSELVYYCVSREEFIQRGVECMTGSVGQQRVPVGYVADYEIPLPPLNVQRQIVAELDGYRKIIEGAKQVIANYKLIIKIDPSWPRVELGPLAINVTSGVTPLGGKENYLTKGVLFIRSQNILHGECDFSDAVFISPEMHKDMSRSRVETDDVLLNITGASIGRCAVFKESVDANVNQHVCIIRVDSAKLLAEFLCAVINDEHFQAHIMQIQSGASRQALNYQQIRGFDIPLPSIAEQRRVIEELRTERALVDANRRLVEIFEKKIQDKLAEIWGDEGNLAR